MTVFETISVIIAGLSIPAFLFGIFKEINNNMKELEKRRKQRESEKHDNEHTMMDKVTATHH